MEKTVLKLSKNISIIILSFAMLLFSLVNNYIQINNSVSFLFLLTKCCVFTAVPLIIYIIEKYNDEFKKVAGIYTGYSIIKTIITLVSSMSVIGNILPQLWIISLDFINLVTLLTSVFVFTEQCLEYSNIRSKLYSNIVMKIVYYLGNLISYPFLVLVNKKWKILKK